MQYLTNKHEQEKNELFQIMDNNLNLVAKFTNSSHFFQNILKVAFNKVSHAPEPIIELANVKKQLQLDFPDRLRFVVWDQNGELVTDLCDETKYRFMYKKLQPFLQKIAGEYRVSTVGNSEIISYIESNLKQFRPLLGKFIIAKDMNLPFLSEDLAECILADNRKEFQLIWFDSTKDLTVLCYVNKDNSMLSALDHITQRLNRLNPQIETGIIDINQTLVNSTRLRDNKQSKILLELAKYENSAFRHRVLDNSLIAFRLLSSNLRTYCYIDKQYMKISNPAELTNSILIKTIAMFLLFYSIYYCYGLVSGSALSIRKKSILFFLYANGVPFLMLSAISWDHINQYEKSVFQEAHEANENFLREIDSGFEDYTKEISAKITNRIKKVIESNDEQLDTGELASILDDFQANEICVFDKMAVQKLSLKSDRDFTVPYSMMADFSVVAFELANIRENDASALNSPLLLQAVGLNRNQYDVDRFRTSLLNQIRGTIENIAELNLGSQSSLCIAFYVGDKARRDFHSMLFVIWDAEHLQAQYIKNLLGAKDQRFNFSNKTLFAMLLNEKSVIAADYKEAESLTYLLDKANRFKIATENKKRLGKKNMMLTAIAGTELSKLSLGIASPLSEVIRQVKTLRFKVIFIAILNFLIIGSISITLTRQFISPIKQLSEIMLQIKRQNYDYIPDISNNDEFGDLGQGFAEALSGLKELSLGQSTQNSLFPKTEYEKDKLRFFGKTICMSKLGGDIFDYFEVDDSKLGVFIGDVAGHGVPAAILMAAAKGTLMLNRHLASDPSAVLKAMHKVFYSLQNKKIRKMMTCQFLLLDIKTGECLMSNCGHCYPILLKASGEIAFVEAMGMPVGVTKILKNKNISFKLERGDRLFMYSDSLLESLNSKGELFGPDRLLETVKNNANDDLEHYYSEIFKIICYWGTTLSDDTSLLILDFDGTARIRGESCV